MASNTENSSSPPKSHKIETILSPNQKSNPFKARRNARRYSTSALYKSPTLTSNGLPLQQVTEVHIHDNCLFMIAAEIMEQSMFMFLLLVTVLFAMWLVCVVLGLLGLAMPMQIDVKFQ